MMMHNYNIFVVIEIAMQVGLTQHIHTSFMVSGEESRRKKRSSDDRRSNEQ